MGAVNEEEGKTREEKAARLRELCGRLWARVGRAGYRAISGQICGS
jgi:hypothetical protein